MILSNVLSFAVKTRDYKSKDLNTNPLVQIEMLLYVLIGLSLSLAGVVGLQFMYLFYLDRLDKERKKRLHELEQRCLHLTNRINHAQDKIAEQIEMLDALNLKTERDEEAWADLIEEN